MAVRTTHRNLFFMLLWHTNNGTCDMSEREGATSASFNHMIDHSDQGDCEDELTQIVSEVESNFPISHMNLKSSVLCPQTRSLTSQYLALEQLNAHQRMIARAKGCVDTSAPKSLQSYLSSLDKRKKALGQMSSIAKGTSMNGSISESRVLSPSADHTENVRDQQEIINDSSDGSLNKGIQASIPFPGYSSKVADKISWYLEAVHQGEFLLQESGNRSRTERNAHRSISRSSLSSSIRSSKVVKGDILDWHQDKFTQSGRLFSPRILVNNNSKSKVRDMRCYNPPRRRKANSSINSTETFESYEDDETPTKDNSSYKEWLSEQAWRAQARRQIKSRMIDPGNSHYMSSHDLAAHETHTGRQFDSRSPLEVITKDEEEKYLNFLSEVTEDILRSGVYTDRAIRRAFQFHLQFHNRDADRDKLQQLLEQVLEDLRISNDEGEDPFKKLGLLSTIKDTSTLSSSPPEKESLDQLLSTNSPRSKMVNFEFSKEPQGLNSKEANFSSLASGKVLNVQELLPNGTNDEIETSVGSLMTLEVNNEVS